jgi:hypothetical protein
MARLIDHGMDYGKAFTRPTDNNQKQVKAADADNTSKDARLCFCRAIRDPMNDFAVTST